MSERTNSKQDRNKLQFYTRKIKAQKPLTAEQYVYTKFFPMHWHNFVEVEIILEGSGELIYNGKKFPFEKGLVNVARLTDYHQQTPYTQTKAILINFEESLLPQKLLDKLWSCSDLCKVHTTDTFKTIEYLARILVLETGKDNSDTSISQKVLECLLIKLLAASTNSNASLPRDISPIQRSLQYIRTHFKQNPSLSEVASLLHYNPRHFCTLFHKEIGLTYHEYITKLKIDYAKNLLITTNLGIDYIRAESGFSSPATFRRTFKEICGVSPGKFRKPNN